MKIFCFSLFNFTVPFVSFLAILLIMVIAFVMYLIPFNYICMIWGMSIMYLYNFNVNDMRCIKFLILSSSFFLQLSINLEKIYIDRIEYETVKWWICSLESLMMRLWYVSFNTIIFNIQLKTISASASLKFCLTVMHFFNP